MSTFDPDGHHAAQKGAELAAVLAGGAAAEVVLSGYWRRTLRLEALVRWLALPYGGMEPIFAGADGWGTADGQPLPGAVELRDTYRQVLGEGEPVEGVERVRCEACGLWHTARVEAPLSSLADDLRNTLDGVRAGA